MARKTFADMQGYVAARLGNRTDVTNTMIEQWLNGALKRISNSYEHKELHGLATETLTAGADSITPAATDIWWPVNVKDSTNGPFLKPAERTEIEALQAKPSGNPVRYHWWGSVFYFDRQPAANTSIKIWYYKKPAYWTSGNSVLSDEYDDVVEMFASLLGHNHLRDFQGAHFQEVEINNWLADMNLPVLKARMDDYDAHVQPRSKR